MCQTAETTKTREFETVTCSRCGGTGNYSYCAMYGTTCFKCAGGKKVFTKRGQVAWNLYQALLKIRAADIKPGMTLIVDNRKYLVESARFGTIEDCTARYLDKTTGEWAFYWEIRCGSYGLSTFPEQMVKIGWTKEAIAQKRAAALDFQDTLTKTGTPRKR
jgi:hypothetical protein